MGVLVGRGRFLGDGLCPAVSVFPPNDFPLPGEVSLRFPEVQEAEQAEAASSERVAQPGAQILHIWGPRLGLEVQRCNLKVRSLRIAGGMLEN